MRATILRTDGTEEIVDLPRNGIAQTLGAKCLDGFSLRDGRYVYVDDLGHQAGKPLNVKATALYHSICRPGTTHQIVGDVAIVSDA